MTDDKSTLEAAPGEGGDDAVGYATTSAAKA
jgi:hypothetical protein